MNAAIAEVEEQHYQRRAAVKPLHQATPRNAKFIVAWKFDNTSTATVTINRRAGLFEVRPFRRRKSYTLPLAHIAELVATLVVKTEVAAKKKLKGGRQ